MQADDVLSRQAVIVRCCLDDLIAGGFLSGIVLDKRGDLLYTTEKAN